jgi:hypothetical protein
MTTSIAGGSGSLSQISATLNLKSNDIVNCQPMPLNLHATTFQQQLTPKSYYTTKELTTTTTTPNNGLKNGIKNFR